MRPEGPRESELDSAERRAEVSRPFRPLPDLDLSFPGHRPAAISPGLRSPGPLGRLKGRFPDTHLYLCWPALRSFRRSEWLRGTSERFLSETAPRDFSVLLRRRAASEAFSAAQSGAEFFRMAPSRSVAHVPVAASAGTNTLKS